MGINLFADRGVSIKGPPVQEVILKPTDDYIQLNCIADAFPKPFISWMPDLDVSTILLFNLVFHGSRLFVKGGVYGPALIGTRPDERRPKAGLGPLSRRRQTAGWGRG